MNALDVARRVPVVDVAEPCAVVAAAEQRDERDSGGSAGAKPYREPARRVDCRLATRRIRSGTELGECGLRASRLGRNRRQDEEAWVLSARLIETCPVRVHVYRHPPGRVLFPCSSARRSPELPPQFVNCARERLYSLSLAPSPPLPRTSLLLLRATSHSTTRTCLLCSFHSARFPPHPDPETMQSPTDDELLCVLALALVLAGAQDPPSRPAHLRADDQHRHLAGHNAALVPPRPTLYVPPLQPQHRVLIP